MIFSFLQRNELDAKSMHIPSPSPLKSDLASYPISHHLWRISPINNSIFLYFIFFFFPLSETHRKRTKFKAWWFFGTHQMNIYCKKTNQKVKTETMARRMRRRQGIFCFFPHLSSHTIQYNKNHPNPILWKESLSLSIYYIIIIIIIITISHMWKIMGCFWHVSYYSNGFMKSWWVLLSLSVWASFRIIRQFWNLRFPP